MNETLIAAARTVSRYHDLGMIVKFHPLEKPKQHMVREALDALRAALASAEIAQNADPAADAPTEVKQP